MKLLQNNKGVALVTSLMLTLISLTIVIALMLMMTSSIKNSAQYKKYKTSLESAYGGTEIMTKDVFPLIMQNYSSATLVTTVTSSFNSSLDMQIPSQKCLQAKLTQPTRNWPAECSKSPNAKSGFDVSFELAATSGNPFIVYSKIVDTTTGNTDVSGLQLEGSGVAEGSSVLTPQHFPFLYRVEVQGERKTSATAQSNIEVLYAY